MLLRLEDISFRFPGATRPVFDGLSLKISDPGFHALFGPSGVGKTSLARIISGDIGDYTGRVDTVHMRAVLYTYNLERLPGWSSVGKHLDKITDPRQKDKRAGMIRAFGLADFMGARFSRLSLGQQNRINLMRYLLQRFDMLIMDESLANVDEVTREKIILTIKGMFPDKIFLYISHNLLEVSKYCDRIFVIRSGGRIPQAVAVKGAGYSGEASFDPGRLEPVMLEIMNVS